VEKLVQELAWRDYWQQVWLSKGDDIFTDLKNQQEPVNNHEIPTSIVKAATGIEAIDNGINEFYQTGYMHNHMRLYVASLCCNLAQSHWLNPAKWLYYHLLDGDLASNHLSWQWVAGANANKKYYANQENINKFFNSNQKNTILDLSYPELIEAGPLPELSKTEPFELTTRLRDIALPDLDREKTTLIYNYYNLDPFWQAQEEAQRVLLLEPSFFKNFPVSEKAIKFILDLSLNIDGIKLFVGEFSALLEHVNPAMITYKEHPTNKHYQGKMEARDWLTSVTGYFPSFFKFWHKAKKELTEFSNTKN
jgi:deoxyribodipyrimidine photo-lyase